MSPGLREAPCRAAHRSERTGTHVVPPNEGNEVRRDGRQGFGASHSTVEAGESWPVGDPVEGRGCRAMEPFEGQMAGTPGPGTIYTKRQRIAVQVLRIHGMRSRMRELRTSGSVGAPGGQPPGATRQKRFFMLRALAHSVATAGWAGAYDPRGRRVAASTLRHGARSLGRLWRAIGSLVAR